jgi:virginiamycin B lyase
VRNHFGLLHKFDVATKKFLPSGIPPDGFYQFLAMAAGPKSDGKIWAGIGEFYRVDPKTLKMDFRFAWTKSPDLAKTGKIHGFGYGLGVDPQGNPWLLDYAASGVSGVDVKTKRVRFFPTPTPDSGPRRGVIDAEGRFWFGEYQGDKIGMFDTKTEKFTEYDPGIKWFGPYTASTPDKHGRVYAPSHSADRVMRADSKTGEVVVYLMPTMDFDSKQMRIDPTDGTSLLFANTRNARIVKLEPLD